jgi:Secretion system C-terminal sorting domain
MGTDKIKLLTLLAFTLIGAAGANSQCLNCNVKGITTNPSNAVNNEFPSKRNTFFDWTNLGLFPVNSQFWPVPFNSIKSPFNQDGNLPLSHLLENPDRLPTDGWELIKYNLGFSEDGTPNGTTNRNLYIVLYNKYTGVLRVFVAANEISAYNGIDITITMLEGTRSSLISNGSKMFALDYFEAYPYIKSVAKYIPSHWMYADFSMTYDPCTCNFPSKIGIEIRYLVSSSISLSGSITGSITSAAEGVKEDGYSITDLTGAGKEAKKTFDNLSKFTNDQFKALKIEGKTDAQLNAEQLNKKHALNQFQDILKDNKLLQTGLKAVPYVGAALELVDFFSAGGKQSAGPQEVKIMPMALQANVRLSGTINTDFLFPGITFYTPGSKDAACGTASQYPYYNEVLGTFNLLRTPKMEYVSTQSQFFSFSTGYLINDVEYALNPAAGFDASKTEIMGNIIFRNPDKTIRQQTGFYPITALKYFLVFADLNFNPELRLLVRLKRADANTNTQDVLYSATYPISTYYCPTCSSPNTILPVVAYSGLQNVEINNTRTNFDLSVPPQNTITIKPGGIILPSSTLKVGVNDFDDFPLFIPPASAAQINALCSDAVYYKTDIRSARKKTTEVDEQETKIPPIPLTVLPNPASDNITIRYSLEFETPVELKIMDVSGRTIATALNEHQTPGNYEISYNISNLTSGVYIYALRTNQGIQTKRLVVIK